MSDFAKLVKEAVEVSSLRHIAEMCDVSSATVKRWMSGQYAPMGPVQKYLRIDLTRVVALAEITRLCQEEWEGQEDWRQVFRCC